MFKIVDENGDTIDVSTIALNPGDVIVLKTNNIIDKKEDFSIAMGKFFPKNRIIVLEKNQEIGVIQQPLDVTVDDDFTDDLYKNRKVLKE